MLFQIDIKQHYSMLIGTQNFDNLSYTKYDELNKDLWKIYTYISSTSSSITLLIDIVLLLLFFFLLTHISANKKC